MANPFAGMGAEMIFLRAEIIALKSFVMDTNLHGKKRSNDKDDKLLVKNSLDQI